MVSSFGKRLGALIKERREAGGFTQRELAEQSFPDLDDHEGKERRIRELESGTVDRPQPRNYTPICETLSISRDQVRQLKTAIDEQVESNAEHLLRENAALAEQLKLSEALVIALAYEYAEGTPTEFDAAMAGLRNALQVAADARAKGRLPSNVDDALSEIIARVDALNDAGEVEAATAALQDEEMRASAGLARLFDKGLAQAVLTRDVDLAVSYEIKRVSLETPDPAALYDALTNTLEQRFVTGRDKGLAFDLEVAIALADTLYNWATTDEERGMALGNKAVALRILGERLQSPGPLAAAVETFEKLLTVFTRDTDPGRWAITQSNLGNTLGTLGARQDDLDTLTRAITAYESALEVRTRDALPLDWARTQNNLGNALHTLGARQDDPDALTRAITAYEAALEVRTRDALPLDWARTTVNVANAERSRARLLSGDAARRALGAALSHIEDALTVFSPENTPYNHGNATRLRDGILADLDALP
ncbi:hypothetical protein [Dinoroseobacter sp. S124A]|uniref:hypothetical protein n=1 Tax=Dinoroseobacter sp. S124A TaxID=3415128 RepID=UPI003C7AD986